MHDVLVTGATGFIGLELSHQLAARPDVKVRATARRVSRAALLRPLDVEVLHANLHNRGSLERAVAGVDTVFHLAGRATFEDIDIIWPTLVDGAVEMAEAAGRAGVERFVYVSSLLVYGDEPDGIDAHTTPAPVIGYGKAKLVAERRLREVCDRHGMVFSALRLPHVYGARDLMFTRIHKGVFVAPGRGHNRYAHLHVDDAVRLLVAVAEQGWSGASAVADRSDVTWDDFFGILRAEYPHFAYAEVPRWLARSGAEVANLVGRSLPWPNLVTPGSVVAWNLEQWVDPTLLWSDLGLEPTYPTVAEGIPAALDDRVAFRWKHPVADRRR